MSGPDPSKTVSAAAEGLRERAEEGRFEADLAELASRFAAQSGGGLSPELSADLALEIVLNEIVEQACLATGATGAAIVLERDGEMSCRASSGATAPELGSRIDTTTGLSGECFRTQRTQWCDDATSDPHADAEACTRLGVRSVIVMPLLRASQLVGVIELFSSRPYAFGIRDERTLEVLADRTLNNLDHAARPLELQIAAESGVIVPEERLSQEGVDEFPVEVSSVDEDPALDHSSLGESSLTAVVRSIPNREPEQKPKRRPDATAWSLGISAFACAILVGVLLGRHWGAEQAAVSPASVAYAAGNTPGETKSRSNASASGKPASVSPVASLAAKPSAKVPPGGLMVFESGKEVFRMAQETPTASTDQGGGMQRASAVEPENSKPTHSAALESRVIRRVEPEYPEAARQQNVQGTVVLEVHMGKDGGVQDVQVVSGPALLSEAATNAVKQWKFQPQLVNGRPVEMQTRITLNFRLPQ